MYCPQCGISQSEDLKFCKSCGANLVAVRRAAATRETAEKFDWTKTWVAEMFLSGEEVKRRKEELELQRGITPEVKRLREMKAGVITASVGVGVAIFLYVFMQGVILSGKIPPHAAEIISRLWVVGVIPLFVGLGLIVNGLFFKPGDATLLRPRVGKEHDPSLTLTDTPELRPPNFSVTDQTTRQLRDSDEKH